MKQYMVEITDDALADMEQLYNHIAFEFLAPDNAMGEYNRIADAILKLDVFPERFRIIKGFAFYILWIDLNHGDNMTCVCSSNEKHT